MVRPLDTDQARPRPKLDDPAGPGDPVAGGAIVAFYAAGASRYQSVSIRPGQTWRNVGQAICRDLDTVPGRMRAIGKSGEGVQVADVDDRSRGVLATVFGVGLNDLNDAFAGLAGEHWFP